MGKRKSAKPQKYVQPSDEEDDDNVDFYDAIEESENISNSKKETVISEKNVRSLWTRDKPLEVVQESKKENDPVPPKESVESEFWASHFPLHPEGTTNNKKFEFDAFKPESTTSPDSHRGNIRPAHQSSPLETLLSERVFNSNPYLEERLRDAAASNHHLKRPEDRHIVKFKFDSDRPKRRRKYVTYPATFRLEVVEHAEKFGKSAAAKKYNICVEKVSMWCKTKDNIVHKVKKSGQPSADGSFDASFDDRYEELSAAGTPDGNVDDDMDEVKEVGEDRRQQISQELEMLYNDDSDSSEKYEVEPEPEVLRRPETVFPPFFKYRVVQYAEEKGEKEASREFHVCEKRLAVWCQAKDYLAEYVNSHKVEEWEFDLYVNLKKLLEDNFQVTVRDLIVRAEQAQLASSSTKSNITTAWLTDWCQKFKVCFRSVIESTPQPLTENTCLILETSLFQVDREESQWASMRGRPLGRSKVVKFAQSHTKHATSRKYGIARRVISRWIADKEVLQTDLLNATQHVLNDSITEEIDGKLLQYYKELKKKGLQVTRSMLCTRANCLFEQQNGTNTTGSRHNAMSATNGWFRHWLVKWKERGEQIEIVDEPDSASSSSTQLPHNNSTPSISKPTVDPCGSSLDALKQAYVTSAILSSMKPSEADLKVFGQFPELLSLIQANPALLGAAAAQLQFQGRDGELLKSAVAETAGVLNLARDNVPETNNHPVYDVYNCNLPQQEDKKKAAVSSVKKRRERYSPDFKLMVIEYAARHSYQETSRKFGVHHITVSEWCKDKERIREKVYCENLQTLHTKILKSETAEQKFLSWIRECNQQKIVIKPTDVQNKANEILSAIGEAEVKKSSWWFYLWNKRGADANEDAPDDVLEKESRVNYPPAVKVEIARVAERQNVNCAARCFRVARKRIREWVKCKDKLRWLAETGQVRERGGSARADCLDVDREVYEWWTARRSSEGPQPQLSEIRVKALEIFQKHGFSNMKCSKEWYKNWCKRYGICRSLQKDNQLIKWILSRYDKNLPITHQELVEYAVVERMRKGVCLGEEPAEEYVFAFCRRYPRLLEALPSVGETFPEEMEAEVAKFRVAIKELQEENSFSDQAIGCMDEVPFLFTNSGMERRVIVNSGMSSWNALVVLSCLADGTMLPPLIVLKGPESASPPDGIKHVVFKEKNLADQHTAKRWTKDIWLKNVPSPSMLLLDCFEPHASTAVQDELLESGVTPVILPEGCASKLQPLSVCVTRHFQEAVQEIWSCGAKVSGGGDCSPAEVARCIAEAFNRLRDRRDLVRRSFVVTGVALAPDGSEDALVENADWFGLSGDEHVLSPAGESGSD